MTSPIVTIAHEGRRHLSKFLSLTTHMLCISDFTDTVLWCNAAFEQILGYEAGELRGVALHDLVHPDDVAAHVDADASLRLGHTVSALRTRHRRKDGAWRTVDWNVTPDPRRQLIRHTGRDVTDQCAADDGLRDNEARLRAILEHSPSAIFVKSVNGRYLVVNNEWSRLTGMAAEDAVGGTTAEMWPTKAADLRAYERELLASGTSLVTDEKMPTPEGERDFIVGRFLSARRRRASVRHRGHRHRHHRAQAGRSRPGQPRSHPQHSAQGEPRHHHA